MKQSYVILLALFLSVVLLGCVKSATQLPQAENLSDQLAACESIPNPSPLKDKCFKEAALRFKVTSPCDKISTPSGIDACYISLAESANDASYCSTLLASSKDRCLQSLATKNSNVSFCVSIQDEPKRNACLSPLVPKITQLTGCDPLKPLSASFAACVIQVAKATKDANACNALSVYGGQDNCIQDLAKQLQDPALCPRIDDLNARNECISNAMGSNVSPAACPLLPDTASKETCYSQLAKKLLDVSYCNNIVTISTFNNCITGVMSKKRDPSLCLKLKPTSSKLHIADDCLNKLAQDTDDASICYQISYTPILQSCLEPFDATTTVPSDCSQVRAADKASCYVSRAIVDRNVPYCKDAPNALDCVVSYASRLEQLASCNAANSFLTYEQRLECQSRYFVGLQDVNGCLNIPSAPWKYTCIANLIGFLNDESYCKTVIPQTYPTQSSICWKNLAVTRKELILCDNIIDETVKVNCYAQLSVLLSDPQLCKQLPATSSSRLSYSLSLRNACWTDLSQLSSSDGYCYEIDQNDSKERCLCAFNKKYCHHNNTLVVKVKIPSTYSASGLSVSLYKNLQLFLNAPIGLDSNSVTVGPIADGNYYVTIVDSNPLDGNLSAGGQSVELRNSTNTTLTFSVSPGS